MPQKSQINKYSDFTLFLEELQRWRSNSTYKNMCAEVSYIFLRRTLRGDTQGLWSDFQFVPKTKNKKKPPKKNNNNKAYEVKSI